MKLHHFLWLFLISLIGVFLCTLLVAYWLFYPYKTLKVNNFSLTKPIHIDTPVVHAGDVISYTLDYCKYIDATPTVHRTLIDGQIITLVNTGGNLPLGCHTTDIETAIVPDTVNSGRYYLDVAVDYKVNPLRTIRTHYFTEYFEVVENHIPSTSKPPVAGMTKVAPPVPVDIPSDSH